MAIQRVTFTFRNRFINFFGGTRNREFSSCHCPRRRGGRQPGQRARRRLPATAPARRRAPRRSRPRRRRRRSAARAPRPPTRAGRGRRAGRRPAPGTTAAARAARPRRSPHCRALAATRLRRRTSVVSVRQSMKPQCTQLPTRGRSLSLDGLAARHVRASMRVAPATCARSRCANRGTQKLCMRSASGTPAAAAAATRAVSRIHVPSLTAR